MKPMKPETMICLISWNCGLFAPLLGNIAMNHLSYPYGPLVRLASYIASFLAAYMIARKIGSACRDADQQTMSVDWGAYKAMSQKPKAKN